MTPRRILQLFLYLVVFAALPLLAQKKAIDPALQKRANAGDAQAQLTLGETYLSGMSVAQDYSKAASWLEKAADHGLAHAQYELGTLYEAGNGVQQDDARSAVLYRQAAEQGFA